MASGSSYVTGTVQGFTSLLQSMAATVQSAASVVVDLAVGSVTLAILEAFGGVALWLQGLVLQVMTMMRLATCVGPDVDSFVAQVGMTRLAAASATCATVQFSRYTATIAATIPVGSLVMTADGTQQFSVIADGTQSTYNASLGAYVIPAGTTSATVTVQAVTPGIGGNVPAGAIALLNSVIVGVDYVTNTGAAAGGAAGETDAALKARFAAFIAALSRSTLAAITYAVQSVQVGLDFSVVENYTLAGVWAPGTFYVVVDDGSGSPPGSLLTSVSNAVNAYRGASVQAAVYAPVVLNINVSVTITTATGYTHGTVVGAVAAAISALIFSTKINALLPYAAVSAAIMAVPGVTNIASLLVNSGTADVQATAQQVMRPGTVTVA